MMWWWVWWGCAHGPGGASQVDAPVHEGGLHQAAPPALPPAGATVTTSGLAYQVLKAGAGAERPTRAHRVVVEYQGWNAAGELFSSSGEDGKAIELGQIVPGWIEGLQLMAVGETTRFWIPEALGYKGSPHYPSGMTVYDIALISMAPLRDYGDRQAVVLLDGVPRTVLWDDGDTFSTPDRALKARLAGYNTLESYGPIHRWGDWKSSELYEIAKLAGRVAAIDRWKCTTLPGSGGYGRSVVDCPELREVLLSLGLAHSFAVDGDGDPADLEVQATAIAGQQGMWAKGVPEGLVTSLHSLDEREGATETYDRVCSPLTGAAPKVKHSTVHTACTEVCHQGSCLMYVPYRQRYGDAKADCLK